MRALHIHTYNKTIIIICYSIDTYRWRWCMPTYIEHMYSCGYCSALSWPLFSEPSGWTAARSYIMFLWHQSHLDPSPPGVQGSWAGFQPNLCLWDTQDQGQGAQRLKDHCLFCVHHCGVCHYLHTHNIAASKWANCPVCSDWNCLPAHSNSTASNNLCSQGNFPEGCCPEHTRQLHCMKHCHKQTLKSILGNLV